MPRKSKTQETQIETKKFQQYKRGNSSNPEWGGFCNIRMSEDDKETFKSWYRENLDMLIVWSSQLLLDGMKITYTYDATNDCFLCTFTGMAYGETEFMVAMSSRAGTPDEALALNLYKHGVKADGDWQKFMDAGKKGYNWG